MIIKVNQNDNENKLKSDSNQASFQYPFHFFLKWIPHLKSALIKYSILKILPENAFLLFILFNHFNKIKILVVNSQVDYTLLFYPWLRYFQLIICDYVSLHGQSSTTSLVDPITSIKNSFKNSNFNFVCRSTLAKPAVNPCLEKEYPRLRIQLELSCLI